MRKTSLSVLLTHSRPVPWTGEYAGSPVIRINSPGCSDTNTLGTAVAAIGLPGRLALTSFQLSSGGSFLKLSGSVPAGVHGPLTSAAFSQLASWRRYNVLEASYWNRSQFVLTAYLRSFSLIGLQIGSPSRLTITAAVLLKKIGGGSAFRPSTFLAMIRLLSMLASTRSSAITRSS